MERFDVRPLWGITLRTPRLELRLPTDEELEQLFDLAAEGIHPPEEMPFGVAWTDDLQHDAFVEFHRSYWRDWSPSKWGLQLVAFLNGRPIGTQGVNATDFGERSEVETGSWIGQEFQRQGFGTEQRAAVLEFAFAGLGALAATTGALFPNVASQRVSEKLGYRVTGTSVLSPRGEPIPHYDYRLERGDWSCPIPVELEGLAPARPLFGAVVSG